MMMQGHNENAVRLAALAGDAQIALDKVSRGEADAVEGWLAYGAALNEGRALFPSDEQFGKWVKDQKLNLVSTFGLKRESDAVCPKVATHEVSRDERAAAMWAAANADQLAEARAACKARTVRGWHDQWKKIEDQRENARLKAEREAEKKRLAEEAEAARKEAEEKAAADVEAQKAIAAASTDEDREAAEAKAERAAEEKAEAERAAAAAEGAAAKAEEKKPETDPAVAKVMKELAKLTPEAVAEEVIGLRGAAADRKAEIKKLKADIEALKDEISLLRQTDRGRTISSEKRRADAAEGRSKEHQAAAARLQRQVNAQKAEIEKLRKADENRLIPL